jgi:hypothetical protein
MQHIKVFFVEKRDDGTVETEGLWCYKSGAHFIVDNIPIVTTRARLGDIVAAKFDPTDKVYYFDRIIAVVSDIIA